MNIHPATYQHPSRPLQSTKKTVFGTCQGGDTYVAAAGQPGHVILVFSADYSASGSTEVSLESFNSSTNTATPIDMPTYAGAEGGAKWGNCENQNPIARTKSGESLRVVSSAEDVGFRLNICHSAQGN